jgi:hypothetical protein
VCHQAIIQSWGLIWWHDFRGTCLQAIHMIAVRIHFLTGYSSLAVSQGPPSDLTICESPKGSSQHSSSFPWSKNSKRAREETQDESHPYLYNLILLIVRYYFCYIQFIHSKWVTTSNSYLWRVIAQKRGFSSKNHRSLLRVCYWCSYIPWLQFRSNNCPRLHNSNYMLIFTFLSQNNE